MLLVEESDFYKIYWHDDEQTILVGEVYGGWTWSTAYEGLKKLNETLGKRAVETSVYSIINFQVGSQMLPSSGSILTNLRNLLKDDPQHEQMTLYVIQTGFLYNMMQIVGKLYGIRHWTEHHRFVTSMEDAMALINEHKNMTTSSDSPIES